MKKLGDKGEIIAINYMIKNGYKLLDTNFKYKRFGEIDLICKLGEITIFVEVKYRSSDKFGSGEESISKQKLLKLKKTIYYYCIKNKIDFEKIRFDIIIINKEIKNYKLIHYKNQELGE